jgi:ADP-ribose pyrophosphatase YjhB (NUDIX family)
MKRQFTATAFVTNDNKVLLMWHKKLKRWMPPGGHVDADELPEECAKRECKEETGLDVEIIGAPTTNLFVSNPHEGRMMKQPFAMLLEEIPDLPERNQPAHQHMDFLFMARLIDDSQTPRLLEKEATEMRWFSRSEIEALDDKTEIFSNVKAYILQELNDES